MNEDLKPRTSDINGPLWGSRARDWAELQEVNFRPLYDAVHTRAGVGPGTRYLDVGCGAGLAAQMAASRGAEVSAIDASEGLLAIASSRLTGGDVRKGDLEELPFADGTFDVVTGFNSFQYTGNPVIALTEARRVAKPGGSVVITTWGDPDGMEAAAIVTATKPLMPPPPPGAPGPFALSDEEKLRAFAAAAGLTPIEVFDVECIYVGSNEAQIVRGFTASGVAARAIEIAGEGAVTKAYAEAVRPFRQPDGSYRIKATFRSLLSRA